MPEQEADEEMERLKIEREQKKKKEEEDSLTLEQTKDQVRKIYYLASTLQSRGYRYVLDNEPSVTSAAMIYSQTSSKDHILQLPRGILPC